MSSIFDDEPFVFETDFLNLGNHENFWVSPTGRAKSSQLHVPTVLDVQQSLAAQHNAGLQNAIINMSLQNQQPATGVQTNGNWNTHPQIYGSATQGASTSIPLSGAGGSLASALATGLFTSNASQGTGQDPRKSPLEYTGIRMGEIIGWRMWCYEEGKPLQPFYKKHVSWEYDTPMTAQNLPDHDFEGIWAFKEPKRARDKMLETGNAVYGSIRMWGDMVEHEDGYRSKFARIATINGICLYENEKTERMQREWLAWSYKKGILTQFPERKEGNNNFATTRIKILNDLRKAYHLLSEDKLPQPDV